MTIFFFYESSFRVSSLYKRMIKGTEGSRLTLSRVDVILKPKILILPERAKEADKEEQDRKRDR